MPSSKASRGCPSLLIADTLRPRVVPRHTSNVTYPPPPPPPVDGPRQMPPTVPITRGSRVVYNCILLGISLVSKPQTHTIDRVRVFTKTTRARTHAHAHHVLILLHTFCPSSKRTKFLQLFPSSPPPRTRNSGEAPTHFFNQRATRHTDTDSCSAPTLFRPRASARMRHVRRQPRPGTERPRYARCVRTHQVVCWCLVERPASQTPHTSADPPPRPAPTPAPAPAPAHPGGLVYDFARRINR